MGGRGKSVGLYPDFWFLYHSFSHGEEGEVGFHFGHTEIEVPVGDEWTWLVDPWLQPLKVKSRTRNILTINASALDSPRRKTKLQGICGLRRGYWINVVRPHSDTFSHCGQREVFIIPLESYEDKIQSLFFSWWGMFALHSWRNFLFTLLLDWELSSSNGLRATILRLSLIGFSKRREILPTHLHCHKIGLGW